MEEKIIAYRILFGKLKDCAPLDEAANTRTKYNTCTRLSLLYYPRILYFFLHHLFTVLTTNISAPERINLQIQYWIIIKVSFILSETVIQHNIGMCDW